MFYEPLTAFRPSRSRPLQRFGRASGHPRKRFVLTGNPPPYPGWARWLLAPRADVAPAIASQLTSGLYTSLPIFIGGVINSIVVASIAAVRHPTTAFILWLGAEIALGAIRLAIVTLGSRAKDERRTRLVGIAAVLSCCWAASVGFGTYISIASGDWILSTIVALSAAAMVSGICLRNFGTPRLASTMMVLSLAPCAIAALLSQEAVLTVIALQLPIYMIAIGSAAFRLNAILVDRMTAQDALEKSEAFNRSILEASPDYAVVLDKAGRITFCHRPPGRSATGETILGTNWLDLLPSESRTEAIRSVKAARGGGTARLTVKHLVDSRHRWFDLAISSVADGSGRVLVVARDITHQKSSEERALWMANHDALTGLPNRVVLQNALDGLKDDPNSAAGCALLVLDIDNFKHINDSLGHDAGDALLCAFAERLVRAVRPGDLIARLGGDEFAIILKMTSEHEVEVAAARIFTELRQPFLHDGRLIDCNASIGACLYPRDGAERSELMKAADIALYSAKAAGRGQLKIYENAMRNEVQSRNSMIHLATRALSSGDIVPYYQPKVRLRDGEVVGFEALLRWRDASGRVRLPEMLKAAFDDPALSTAISDQIIDQALDDIAGWLSQGIQFGSVAINAGASEFGGGSFADKLLEKLEDRRISPDCLQIEVTETVFLGRGAHHVARDLRALSEAGIAIALDDFGTGYASLAHLMQFPVDALKIDKSFIKELGRNDEAGAITKAIVNLGHSLGIEIIAEGVETSEQQLYLLGLGCQTGQGYLYSKAVPSGHVADIMLGAVAKSA